MKTVATFDTLVTNESLYDPIDTNQRYVVMFLFTNQVCLTPYPAVGAPLAPLSAAAFDAVGYVREVP
jgi:hypothetical protein